MTDEVPIPLRIRRELIAAARAAAPREMVGLLGSRYGGCVTDFVPLPNVAAGRDRFAVDAIAFAAAVQQLEASGASFLGFAHSHPDGPTGLSATDRRELWRDCVQLVCGLGDEQIRAFRLSRETVRELAIVAASDPRFGTAGAAR
ncbi:MAG: Mov34/MPN/PAD-1 family protein [Planctomycetes bacterium]|nr:Mov34/MPN/PAD-1 family protein [Planctomycetota bacterium]